MLPIKLRPPVGLAGEKSANFRTPGHPRTSADIESGLAEKSLDAAETYARSLRAQVRALFQGHMPLIEFEITMNSIVTTNLTRAWWEGAAQVGIAPDEATEDEATRLREHIFSETSHISDFGNAILDARGQRRGISRMLDRVELWSLRYDATRSLAMSIFGQDQKLKWVVGPTEHCSSCLTLNGRVYRASVWNRYNIYPRKRSLECGGFRCRCSFQPTTDRATPGRPPQVA